MAQVQAGDIFLMEGNSILDRVINFFQALWGGPQNESTCTHCGVITGSAGGTLETTPWRTSRLNLFDDHPGSPMFIFRFKRMNEKRFERGLGLVEREVGRIYPYWRLVLYALNLSRFIGGGKVCSEIVALFLVGAGARGCWRGIDVDQLHDDCSGNPAWMLVYYGEPKNIALR